ncbi:VOC family protein [Solitalea sp. MAHUQ-68]|uniref:VOC family protein n=1 Tax=Solitalea agri TaxID=2953739 RepID=A0A9X2JDR3_9SPHI|nr:VOC family protein [Solitalea agri]MCO4293904.1 VOC family protein [Solitalea agri]
MATTINPYLTFTGKCEEAFNFYKSVFGGDFAFVGRFKDMPPQEGMPPMPAEAADMLMHISLPIGGGVLMGSDTCEGWGPSLTVGNNITISINATNKEDADRLFNGLSAGGHVTMPMSDTFWGAYFGMFTDKFGINWMVNFDKNSPS